MLAFLLAAICSFAAGAAQEGAPAPQSATEATAASCADGSAAGTAEEACRAGAAPGSAAPKCCKICRTGQPCGDSCINHNMACTEPPGCACEDPDS